MNKRNLEILGVQEDATREQITDAYLTLRAKLMEDRFLDGEAGNNAAKMLTKVEVAYNELMSELSEATSENADAGEAFKKAEDLIAQGNFDEAQRVLDAFNERTAQWHYLQSVVYYRKQWVNESKKQLEIALQLEPDNQTYKDAYKKLNDKIEFDKAQQSQQYSNVYQAQNLNDDIEDDQMGGNMCSQCLTCCYINMCINCLCNSCGGGC